MIIAQCPVCKDTLARGTDIVVAPCGHTYHEFCLMEWLKTKPSCPQCRKQTPRGRVTRLFFDFVEDPTFSSDDPEAKVARLQAELESKETKVDACEALIANLEGVCKAANEKLEQARKAVSDQKNAMRRERAEKERLKAELCHNSELLRQALSDKKELEELRAKVNMMKDIETLLKGSTNAVSSITAMYTDGDSHEPASAGVRHLACLVSVLKRELEALKSAKRSLRRERHSLMKEVAALRRQMAGEADAVRKAEEALRQEKSYTVSLERECDNLRERAASAALQSKERESPSVRKRSSLPKIASGLNTPEKDSTPNDSALDLFDMETPGENRLVIDSRYFDTPETPDSAAKASKPLGVNPFAVGRRSVATEEEEEAEMIEAVKERPRAKPLATNQLQNFSIMRSHLMGARVAPPPPATYDGLGSRQRRSSPVFGAHRSFPAGPSKRLGRPSGRKRVKKISPVGPTLDNFLRRN